MIKLYTWKTPNGQKPAIMLEELDVPYEVYPIDLSKYEQFSEEFSLYSPNNKIPAIVDDEMRVDGHALSIFESGAILTYLADKHNQFLPPSGIERYKVMEWTYWQAANIGPVFGHLGYFVVRAKNKSPDAIERFTKEADRLLAVMDKQLRQYPYLAGKNYSIADMMTYPWVQAATTYLKDSLEISLKEKPSARRWMDLVGNRPAVMRGMKILE